MGVLELFGFILFVVLLGALVTWIMGKLAPNRPTFADGAIWVVVVLLIAIALATAFGFIGYDPRVPRFR